jgi:hypothetical protein
MITGNNIKMSLHIECLCGKRTSQGYSIIMEGNNYYFNICKCGVEMFDNGTYKVYIKNTIVGIIYKRTGNQHPHHIIDKGWNSLLVIPDLLAENIFLANYNFSRLQKKMRTVNLLK